MKLDLQQRGREPWNLRAARQGGKLITWQGPADSLIPPQGTMLYYRRVAALDPSDVADFYRQFYSPGVGHCGNGTGVMPIDPLGQLRDWVVSAVRGLVSVAGGRGVSWRWECVVGGVVEVREWFGVDGVCGTAWVEF